MSSSSVHEFTQPQLSKGTLLRSEYSVGDLIAGKSTGLWELGRSMGCR